MAELTLNGITVEDTFAEAFDVAGTAIIVTNDTAKWAMIAAVTMTGFATSVIGCGAEAGIDAELSPEETPDGRPGVRILLFGFEPNGLRSNSSSASASASSPARARPATRASRVRRRSSSAAPSATSATASRWPSA